MGKNRRIGILPATMFAATLMLTIKVGELWQGADGLDAGIGIASLYAQQAEDEGAELLDEEPDAALEDEADADEAAGDEAAGDDAAGDDAAGDEAALDDMEIDESMLLDGDALSRSELDVLQRLRDRRAALDARERALEMRENLADAAEHAIESRIADWERLQSNVEALLGQFGEEQENDLRTLAVYYEKMKPNDAARVFNELEMSYLVDIVQRMKDASVADIIGKMETEKARLLTIELAERLRVPDSADALMSQR